MAENPLRQLETLGQSLWLDYIRRDLIDGGDLQRMIAGDGLRGMTSNPAIFEKAIAESEAYDAEIKALAGQGKDAFAIYDQLSQSDVRSAADAFRGVFDRTNGLDGYVSLEVNPHLARDTQGTVAEARRLWAGLKRPNVLIKVPATVQGLAAIQALVGEGINVNVTLIFGLKRYREVALAYVAGLEALAAAGRPLAAAASVASFFISRIDAAVDPALAKAEAEGPALAPQARAAKGKVAVASAKAAYQMYKGLFSSERFRRLAERGARPQRLLWASTSTKTPGESDVKYVEALIGADTVDTAPLETVTAYRDHGRPKARLEDDLAESRAVLGSLPELGVFLEDVTQNLEDEGVAKFNQPFDKLLETIKRRS